MILPIMSQTHPPPDPSLASPIPTEPVSDLWAQMMQLVLAAVLLAGTFAAYHYYTLQAAQPSPADPANDLRNNDLQNQVHDLSAQVAQLRQEQSMPAVVLNRYRNSIGYIYGVYHVGYANRRPEIRARVSGTGFLISNGSASNGSASNGLVATNRHVAEPWYGDPDAERLLDHGATAMLESLVIFFPNSPTPVTLVPASASKTSDLAVLRVEDSSTIRGLPTLPLSKSPAAPGQLVTVIGYPMGIAGMVAKSPEGIYQRLAYRHNDISAASELAALSLIRPSTTCGHLGDVVGEKLIYDAPTAHGGSGGPVFNSQGEVIGVNSAFMDGFSGGTLGISVEALRPLLQAAQQR